MRRRISKTFSFRGYSLKEWLLKNNVEVIKVAGAIAGAILFYAAGLPTWGAGLVGLVVKFGLDALHYFLFKQ